MTRKAGSKQTPLRFTDRAPLFSLFTFSSLLSHQITSTMSTSAQARLAAVQKHLAIQPCFYRHAIHGDEPTGPGDLARERAGASFDVKEMTEVIHQGKENVDAMVRSFDPCTSPRPP